ncbi:MAG: hypothetical protein ACE5OZ_13080 [Candidatus Heimdallarchaeota archaeon]
MRKLAAVLEGKTITPIITKRRSWHIRRGGQVRLLRTRKTAYSKITVGAHRPPSVFYGYEGTVQIRRRCSTETGALTLLNYFLQITKLGRFKNEGMGLIDWQRTWIEDYHKPQGKRKRNPKIRIRQNLPKGKPAHGGLSEGIQRLLLYYLLHDFFKTAKHPSKIFQEIDLDDLDLMEVLRKSHDKVKPDDPFLQTMTRYDQLAAMLGRKRYAPVNDRYNFQAQQNRKRLPDRAQLAREISQVVNEKSVYELYRYIYESEELDWLVETRECGYSSLRTHLLIGANMIVHSYQKGYLGSLTSSSAQEP